MSDSLWLDDFHQAKFLGRLDPDSRLAMILRTFDEDTAVLHANMHSTKLDNIGEHENYPKWEYPDRNRCDPELFFTISQDHNLLFEMHSTSYILWGVEVMPSISIFFFSCAKVGANTSYHFVCTVTVGLQKG